MRIVFAAMSNGCYGGVKKTYQVAEGLVKLGHDVLMWAPKGKPDWFPVSVPVKINQPNSADIFVVSPKWPNLTLPRYKHKVCYVGGRRDDLGYNPDQSGIDLNICVSSWVAAAYEQFHTPLAVIPLGFDASRMPFVTYAEKDKNAVAFMPRKNGHLVDRILLAMGEHISISLNLLAIDGLTECQVASALGRASVFLAISTWDGFPLPPMEAMLCGALVVGFCAGGGAEYMKKDVNYLAVEGPIAPHPYISEGVIQKFALQVVRALKSPELQIRQNALALARSFTLECEALSWSQMLQALL